MHGDHGGVDANLSALHHHVGDADELRGAQKGKNEMERMIIRFVSRIRFVHFLGMDEQSME